MEKEQISRDQTEKQEQAAQTSPQTGTEQSAADKPVTEHKDESQSYMDYNGNSEANAPARARE